MGRLSGKIAIVTGGGTGIGGETARLYAEEGARVVVGDIRPEDGEATVKAITDAGGEAVFVATDVSKSADVEVLVAAAESEFGGLHVMTANAGILGRGHNKSLVDLSEEEIDQIVAFNNEVSWEDEALVDSVQEGLDSGAVPHGRLMPESEALIGRFQRLLYDALTGGA